LIGNDNSILRRKVIRSWRKIHNRELHLLYSSNIITLVKSWRVRSARYAVFMGQMRIAYNVSVGNPEGKRILAKVNIKWKYTHCITILARSLTFV
jgi:hypothetical protein